MLWLIAALLQQSPPGAALHLEFPRDAGEVRLVHGARPVERGLEFTNALQSAEVDPPDGLDGIEAITIGGWFHPRGAGEQCFFFRGLPERSGSGERWFRPEADWVNFVLGTDERGFFLATANGNGSMPFPFVTLNPVPVHEWSQLALVKDAAGYQSWYRNGTLVWSDREAEAAPRATPFRERAPGEPVRLAMALGGFIGEVWVVPRALSAEEIAADFEAKKGRYAPALPAAPVALREIDLHPDPGLWKPPVTAGSWPAHRERILAGFRQVFGRMPVEKPPLEPLFLGEEDCGRYVRRKLSIQVEPGERMPFYLLVPKELEERAPAIICFYGTTSGAGKETTAGLSGRAPGTPPAKNAAFAVDMAEAGFVALAADYLRDGERVEPGRRPYDTTGFYERHPEWSIHGKDAWDTSRAIDYLETLDFVDAGRIGMVGHSYGGHSTIFTAAIEPRIRAAWANGPVSDFLLHGLHWAVPKGGGASQSLPGMRPYVLDRTRPPPITFYEVTALLAPRPLAVSQAVGERRPREEENHAAVKAVYQALGAPERVRYLWYPGDHDFPPHVRREAVGWFGRWLR
jgi:hypothetical protein